MATSPSTSVPSTSDGAAHRASTSSNSGGTAVHRTTSFAELIPSDKHLSFVLLGASGDLAKRKIYPALFSLYAQGLLPESFVIYGYARSNLSIDELVSHFKPFVSKLPKEWLGQHFDSFVKKLSYVEGQYDADSGYQKLRDVMQQDEEAAGCFDPCEASRIFYLSLPPSVFQQAAEAIGRVLYRDCIKLLIEKPFGRSLVTFKELNTALKRIYKPEQLFRIDHYITKEAVQNLLVLRFSNLIFESIWHRGSVRCIQILFSENLGVEGRGGYYDEYGVIRDILTNHALQVLAILCMEPPISLRPEDISAEKVKVLRCIPPLTRENIVIGQYRGRKDDSSVKGYTEDPSVRPDSITPTFAACVLTVKNRRWDGVPILLKAGKGLEESKVQIRVQLNNVPGGLYAECAELQPNELIIDVQPNESLHFNIMTKVPGLHLHMSNTSLDLNYRAKYSTRSPDAYERLVYECLMGDARNFVRDDELDASWRIFDTVLEEFDRKKIRPDPYMFGSRGPSSADYLAAKWNCEWRE